MTRNKKIVLVNNYRDGEKGRKALSNIARCTDQTPMLVEHDTANLAELVTAMQPSLVLLSGSEFLLSKPGTKQRFKQEMELVSKADFPVLGICFGHQLIGTAFGTGMTDLGQMVRRFEDVNIVDHNPLFENLPSTISVAASHRQVLDRVPDGFARLAHSATSDIEAIGHKSLPIYGLQFHPERADDAHPHGQILLRNMVHFSDSA